MYFLFLWLFLLHLSHASRMFDRPLWIVKPHINSVDLTILLSQSGTSPGISKQYIFPDQIAFSLFSSNLDSFPNYPLPLLRISLEGDLTLQSSVFQRWTHSWYKSRSLFCLWTSFCATNVCNSSKLNQRLNVSAAAVFTLVWMECNKWNINLTLTSLYLSA